MKSYSLTLYVLIISIVVLSLIKYKKIRDFFSLIFSVLLSLAIIVFLPYCPVKYQYIIIWMSLFFLTYRFLFTLISLNPPDIMAVQIKCHYVILFL
jgi:phosphatidylserine synthase